MKWELWQCKWAECGSSELYSCLNKEYLMMECTLAKQTLQNKEMESFQEVHLLKAAFPMYVH